MNTMQLSMILAGPSLHMSQPIVPFYSSSTTLSHQILCNRIARSSRPTPDRIHYADHTITTASSSGNSSGNSSGKSSDEPSTNSRNDSPGVVKPSQAQSQKSEVSSDSPQKPRQSEELPSDMTELVQWGGTLPSGRRIVIGAAVGLAVALGSDFIGITSLLLGLAPDLSRELRADLLYPVRGFKRCYEASRGFEFVYPARWVGDQRLVYRAVERAERERSLDLPSLRIEQARNRRRAALEPLVAYGPPGSKGELNVSVVVAPLVAGFSLEKFGSPTTVGERILSSVIAPEGSSKTARLISASQSFRDSLLYYTLEYTVQSSTFFRHNLSVYVAYDDNLFSLNAQTPETEWLKVESSFITMAKSFTVVQNVGGAPKQDIPKML